MGRLDEEVCRAHVGLYNANACSTVSPLAYGSRIRIDTLVLPSRDAPLRPGRALRFDGAIETGGGPVTLQNLAGLLFGVAIGQ